MHRFFIAPELLANIDVPPGNVVAPLAGARPSNSLARPSNSPAIPSDPSAMPSNSPAMPSDLSARPSTPPTISLPKDLSHQIRDVLHLSIGEQLLLLDNTGDEILAAVTESNKSI